MKTRTVVVVVAVPDEESDENLTALVNSVQEALGRVEDCADLSSVRAEPVVSDPRKGGLLVAWAQAEEDAEAALGEREDDGPLGV